MTKFYLDHAIFKTKEIIGDFPSERSMQLKIKSLINKGLISKIKNGLYASINNITGDIFANRFEIATALFDNSYVAYHSALEFYGLGNQMFSEVYVITEKRYATFLYNGLEYRFFLSKIKGGIIHLEQNSEVVITDLERTIVDCLDRIDLAGGIEELVMAINGITYLNEQSLLSYLEEYNKKFLYKKTGFLLSMLKKDLLSKDFFEICKKNSSNKIDDISENKKMPREMDKYWMIIYPSNLINKEN